MEKVFVVTLKEKKEGQTFPELRGVEAVFATRSAALRRLADVFFNYLELSEGEADIEITNHGGRIRFVDNSVQYWNIEEQEVQ